MVTLSDVAARAGVSVSAVSRVLSDAPRTRVGEETRERIRQAAAELGYRPNFAARALKSARTHVVGLVVPDVTNAIFSELLEGVEQEAHRRGYVVLLARADGAGGGDDAIARLIGEGRVDGILAQLGASAPTSEIDGLDDASSPVVYVNSRRGPGVSSVVLDDEAGVRCAVDHLIALGHRRIGLLGGVAASDTARRREAGFRAATLDAGLELPDEWVTRCGYDPADGASAFAQLFEVRESPTAVVVANVNAAYGVLRAARRAGVRVPEDLSVVAMHDAWTAEYSWPALTTVRMPLRELGREALAALVRRMDHAEVADVVLTETAPVLCVRESTASPFTG